MERSRKQRKSTVLAHKFLLNREIVFLCFFKDKKLSFNENILEDGMDVLFYYDNMWWILLNTSKHNNELSQTQNLNYILLDIYNFPFVRSILIIKPQISPYPIAVKWAGRPSKLFNISFKIEIYWFHWFDQFDIHSIHSYNRLQEG